MLLSHIFLIESSILECFLYFFQYHFESCTLLNFLININIVSTQSLHVTAFAFNTKIIYPSITSSADPEHHGVRASSIKRCSPLSTITASRSFWNNHFSLLIANWIMQIIKTEYLVRCITVRSSVRVFASYQNRRWHQLLNKPERPTVA